MQIETDIYKELRTVIPTNAEKIIVFAKVESSNYEIFYYSYKKGKTTPRQCYELAEENEIDGSQLDAVFAYLADYFRTIEVFRNDKINVFTITLSQLDAVSEAVLDARLEVAYYNHGDRIYRIKKEWKDKYLLAESSSTLKF